MIFDKEVHCTWNPIVLCHSWLLVVYQHGQSRICGGATGSDVTGPDRKWRHRKSRKWPHAHFFPAFFPLTRWKRT